MNADQEIQKVLNSKPVLLVGEWEIFKHGSSIDCDDAAPL
jgi:hypothetical protein